MQVTKIEVHRLNLIPEVALTVAYGSYARLEYALIKVFTDDGLVGLGEASPDPEVTGETQASVITALGKAARFLVGADPFDIEAILTTCAARLPGFPAAWAAIDMAMFDLMGQSAGLPVCDLLGGRSVEHVPLYPVIPLDTPEQMAQTSQRFAKLGVRVLKIKLGGTPEEDLRRLQAVRDAVGGDVRLRLDINQGWVDAATTIRALGLMKDFKIEWVEQPVAAADLDGLAAVSAAVDLPIMADEACHNAQDVYKIAQKNAARMINIKLMKCGGLLNAGKMLATAQAAGLECILGSMGESSIGSAAGIHFASAKPGILACEVIGPLFLQGDPAEGFLVDMTTLQAYAGEGAGLGVRLK